MGADCRTCAYHEIIFTDGLFNTLCACNSDIFDTVLQYHREHCMHCCGHAAINNECESYLPKYTGK